MAKIYLAHVTVYDPALPGTRVLYLSSANFVTGTTNLPPGGASHTSYDPRIKQPANMQRSIFSDGTTSGKSQVGYGAMELVNVDGGLDSFLTYGLDGRPITILVGEVTPSSGGAPTWTTAFVGTMDQPEISWNKVSIRLRDRQAELARKPAAPNVYGGTNSLPNGLDGTPTDLQGKNKPRVFGQVYNISPPCVNTSKLIYQVNDGAIDSVDAVYDRGAGLTRGADYTDQTDMLNNAPAAGTYRVLLSGGYFRLGSSPAGLITCDVAQGGSLANRSAAQVAYAIVTGPGGISSSDVTAADITALDVANNWALGAYVDDATNCADVLDQVAGSVGAWWGFDRLGKFRIARLEDPSAGTSVVTITSADIIKIDRKATSDADRGIPAYKVTINYNRFYTTQESDLAGSVTASRRAQLALEYRSSTQTDSSVQTKHLLATELSFDTLVHHSSAASGEASRRLALYKVDRSMYSLRVALDANMITKLDLGAIVTLQVNRFSMSAGKKFAVVGIQPDLKNNRFNVTLWG